MQTSHPKFPSPHSFWTFRRIGRITILPDAYAYLFCPSIHARSKAPLLAPGIRLLLPSWPPCQHAATESLTCQDDFELWTSDSSSALGFPVNMLQRKPSRVFGASFRPINVSIAQSGANLTQDSICLSSNGRPVNVLQQCNRIIVVRGLIFFFPSLAILSAQN